VILRTPDGNAKVEAGQVPLAFRRGRGRAGRRLTRRASATSSSSVDDIKTSLAALQAQGGELVGELVNYENSYWLCYVRGPAGTIVELAEKIS